jgi:hypothetical protein
MPTYCILCVSVYTTLTETCLPTFDIFYFHYIVLLLQWPRWAKNVEDILNIPFCRVLTVGYGISPD